MFNVACPVEDCDGEFEVQAFSDSEGDAGVIGGTHNFINWDIISNTCNHDESEFDSKTAQRLADSIIVEYGNPPDPDWMP